METPYTQKHCRALVQDLFRLKFVRSWFTRFTYYTGKPWFFGPFAQSIADSTSAYLLNNVMPQPGAPISIQGHAQLAHSTITDVTGQRVALMAHWDPQGIIDDYVRYYARHLRDMGFTVILTSACKPTLTDEDIEVFSAIMYRTCAGYDFTSHKAAFELFPSLYNASALLITNDSIFAPIGTLEPVFVAMKTVACDFWGLAEKDGDPRPFLHSYFLLLTPSVLQSALFKAFIDSIELRADKPYACNLEEIFTCLLAQAGFIPAAYLPAQSLPCPGFGMLRRAWRVLLPLHMAFVKRSLLTDKGTGSYTYKNWQKTFSQYGYPVPVILAYLQRCGITIKS